MRITFLLPIANLSGGVRVAVIHAKNLAQKGHDVTLVSSAPAKPNLKKKIKYFLRNRKILHWEKNTASHLDGTNLTHILIDHGKPFGVDDIPVSDAIVATWWETAEWLMKLPHSHGAKVYFIQAHETFDFLPLARVEATYLSDLYKITISSWLQDLMKYRYHTAQCDLVPNAVDHQQFNAPVRGKQRRPSVGFLYSIATLKRSDISLKIAEKLLNRYDEIRIVVFGAKSNHELQRNPRIEFIESPAQNKIKEIYASCDVWLSTSRSEGFNLMAMEAMACRTPVVSTKTGWPAEAIVDGVNGYLEEIDDMDGLYKSVIKVLELPEAEWCAMSERAFDTVRNAEWGASTDLFEKSLLNAIGDNKNHEMRQ